MPWLGASASLMFLRIAGSTTSSGKASLTSLATCWLSRVGACMVSSTPSTPSLGFRRALTSLMVPASRASPSRAKYSVWTGIRMPSLATSALTGTRPSVGGVSMRTMS